MGSGPPSGCLLGGCFDETSSESRGDRRGARRRSRRGTVGARADAAAAAARRRRCIPIQVTGPPAQRLNLIILGDGYQCGPAEPLPRRRGPEPLGHVGDRAVPHATATTSTSTRSRSPRSTTASAATRTAACGSPDGTIRDTGVREGPIDGKNTALRMIFQNGCADPLVPRHRLRRRAGQLRRRAAPVLPGRA